MPVAPQACQSLKSLLAALALGCGGTLSPVQLMADDQPATASSSAPAASQGAKPKLILGPETTVVSAPLNKFGYPDYLAAVNQQISASVVPEKNFWVKMWPIIGNTERSSEDYIAQVEKLLGVTISREPRLQHPLSEIKSNTPEWKRLEEEFTRSGTRPWTRQEFPDLARLIDKRSPLLDEVLVACQCPQTYAPLLSNSDGPMQVVSALLPHVQSQRQVARMLASRAMLSLGEGNRDAAWQDLLAMYRLAAHTERGTTLIESLVGFAIRHIALQPTAAFLTQPRISPDKLDACWTELEPLLQTRSLEKSLLTERFMYLDAALAINSGGVPAENLYPTYGDGGSFVDSGAGGSLGQAMRDSRQLMFQLIMRRNDINETLRYGNRMYDELEEALRPERHTERSARLKAIEDRVEQDGRVFRDTKALALAYFFSPQDEFQQLPGKALTALLIPAISGVETAKARVECHAPLLHATYLCQRRLAAGGEFPLEISDFASPEQLQQLTDPFTNEPIRMVVDGRGLVLYSVGVDGIDNSGNNHEDTPRGDDMRLILPLAP